jgi:presenilin-like A22 family membrane protease
MKNKATTFFEERKFKIRDIIIMVLAMGIMVTLIAFIPGLAIKILFIIIYTYMIFSFTYIFTRKWYWALIPSLIFLVAYLLVPNLLTLNIAAILFAIIISVYLGVLFSWKTTLIFALLLMIMDIIQVFITGFMIQAAVKMMELQLPIAIIIPTYPSGTRIMIGLGDIFLSGLLAIQTAQKHGQKKGIVIAATIGVAFFIFEVIMFNEVLMGIRGFPATIIVILGWLMGIGIIRLAHYKPRS